MPANLLGLLDIKGPRQTLTRSTGVLTLLLVTLGAVLVSAIFEIVVGFHTVHPLVNPHVIELAQLALKGEDILAVVVLHRSAIKIMPLRVRIARKAS